MRPRNESAITEMARVLDRQPDASAVDLAGGVRITAPWSHGELHDATRPMHEHVLMTYHGEPREIRWTDGRTQRRASTRPGTVTIIPAGHAARWDIEGGIAVSHVYLPPARLCRAEDGARPWELLDRVAVQDATLAGLLAVIAAEAHARDASARLMVERALEMVALQLGRQHVAAPSAMGSARGGLAPGPLRRVTDFMQARLAEPVTLDELAALAGLSRFHFCTAFHRSMGVPPHAWLRALRMREARQLLLHSRLSVLEVALSVGYDSPSAFAKAFRATEGMSPAALRRTAL